MIEKGVNPHFYGFVDDWESSYYLLIGGYGSSKSYHVALKIILKLMQEKRTCLVVREVYDTIRDSCYSLFVEICGSLDLEAYVTFTRSPMQMIFANGSRVIFRGLDKPAKLKSINNVSLIWIEEAAEIRYAAFKELVGRLRSPSLKTHMILSLNPTAKSNWVYEHFFVKKELDDERLYAERILRIGDTYYHHSTIDDNKFLQDSYRATLEEMRSYDADLYRVAREGRFGSKGAKVLPAFEVMNHSEVMEAVSKIPARYKYVGMDLGFVESYNSVVRVAVDNERKWLYVYWNWYERGLTDDEIVDRLREFVHTREVIRVDSASPKSIRYFQKNGLNAVAAKKWSEGVRRARLANVRKMRRFKRIICSDNCPYVIGELRDLVFAQDRNDNIIEDEFSIDAHCLDAMIYALDSYDLSDLKFALKKSDFGL